MDRGHSSIGSRVAGHLCVTARRAASLPRMRIEIRVHPRARHRRLVWDGRIAAVWVTEPAADGRANRAVIAAVAGWLGVAPSRVRIVAGTRSRTKLLDVDGLDAHPPAPPGAEADPDPAPLPTVDGG